MLYISYRLVENRKMILLRCPKFASLNSIATLTLFLSYFCIYCISLLPQEFKGMRRGEGKMRYDKK